MSKNHRQLFFAFLILLLIQHGIYLITDLNERSVRDFLVSAVVSLPLWWVISFFLLKIRQPSLQLLAAAFMGMVVMGSAIHCVHVVINAGFDVLARDLFAYRQRNGVLWFLPILVFSSLRLSWLLCVLSLIFVNIQNWYQKTNNGVTH
jgi:hypothetical protein